jgi:hypothetical protein
VQRAEKRLELFTNVNGALVAQGGAPAFDLVEAGLELLRADGERNPEKYRLPPPPPPPQAAPMATPGAMPAEDGAPAEEMAAEPSPNVIPMEGAA